MISTKIIPISIVVLILSLHAVDIVAASDMVAQTQIIEEFGFVNPVESELDLLLNLVDNNTDDYNNYNYTQMNSSFNINGKYIYPMTPPIEIVTPVNVTYAAYANTFTLSNNIFSGASDLWFRLPFVGNYTGAKTDYGNFTTTIYQLYSRTGNVTSVGEYGATISGTSRIIWNITTNGTTAGNHYFKNETVTTPLGRTLEFYWVRVSAPISTNMQYVVYFKHELNGTGGERLYFTEGDSFGDDRHNSWLKLSTNNSVYLPFDLDVSIFINNTLHSGISGVQLGYTQQFLAQWWFNHYNTGTTYFWNFIVPIVVDNDELTIETFIYFSDATNDYFANWTDVINGESYIHLSLDPTNNKDVVRIQTVIKSNNSKNFTVFMVESWRGFDAAQDNNVSCGIIDTTNEYFFSSMAMYGYASLDNFQYILVAPDFEIIPFFGHGVVGEDIIQITFYRATLRAMDIDSNYWRNYSQRLEGDLKVLLAISSWPLKLIDMSIDGLTYIGGLVIEGIKWMKDKWSGAEDANNNGIPDILDDIPGIGELLSLLSWLKDGIEQIIGFMIEIAELVIEYAPYFLYMLTKGLAIFLGLSIMLVVVNFVDSIGRGLKAGAVMEYIACQWRTTRGLIVFIITIIAFVYGVIAGFIQAVLPF